MTPKALLKLPLSLRIEHLESLDRGKRSAFIKLLIQHVKDNPPGSGAICYPDGQCGIGTPAEAEASGGYFQGEGTSCEDSPCQGVCRWVDHYDPMTGKPVWAFAGPDQGKWPLPGKQNAMPGKPNAMDCLRLEGGTWHPAL